MKANILIYFVVITLLVAGCATQAGPSMEAQAPSPTDLPQSVTLTPTKPPSRVLRYTVPAPSLANNTLNEKAEREITVLLPPSYYASQKHYPVIYYLAGWFENSISVAPVRIDRLMDQGKIQELIVVTVDGKSCLLESHFANSAVNGNWEDFITRDLVEYMDANYRTIPSAGSRAIAGLDVGGYGSLIQAMKHPDVFSSVYVIDPDLFDPNGLEESPLYFVEGKPVGVFSQSYGAAFSPDPKAANHVQYPNREGKKLVHDEIWQRWQMGYGGPAAEVEKYKENWLKLKGIGIVYSTIATEPWQDVFLKGGAYFVEQMEAAGIPVQVHINPMGYLTSSDVFTLTRMLPFLSERLEGEGS